MLRICKYHLRVSVSMCVGEERAEIVFLWILPPHLSLHTLHNSCSFTWVPTSFYVCGDIFPLYFIVRFSHKTEFPQGVKDCVLLIFMYQCQEQRLTLAHIEREKCLLNLFERFVRELPWLIIQERHPPMEKSGHVAVGGCFHSFIYHIFIECLLHMVPWGVQRWISHGLCPVLCALSQS